ncbi:helix-turn-helix domain-containing protein [Kitasatospora sp. NBC_01287]|uniref:helix-turn-helix domain-containing protein n=1 Tax=Kitasatospora sp. NBC_01287 TaxID=2903573 RepID=UPI0022502732|nr:helix-turn-helix transcriptional regulator [Kitasatospora sp. NBC_01287]MCX4749061.1 helix-turn-helix domain-containing protein [Kitasatospora sp. NBC_01287]
MTADMGSTLRELRQASGKEAKAVARSAAMSPSKLSRIETGKLSPSVMDADRILTALGVSDEVRAGLIEVARREATEAIAWRSYRRTGLHHHQDAIRAVESDTTVQRVFQPSCIPGLCQTPEYIRAILDRKELTEDIVTRTVAARLHRQSALFDSTRSFRYLITESVLRWRLLSPPEMAVQLDRLTTLSRLPNVWLGIVPLSAPMSEVSTSSFIVYDSRLVIVEIPHAEITTTEPKDIELYRAKFDNFELSAIVGDAMRNMIEGIRDEFLKEQETAWNRRPESA